MEEEKIASYIAGDLTHEENCEVLKASYKDPLLKKKLLEYHNLNVLIGLKYFNKDKISVDESYDKFLRRLNKQKRDVFIFSFLKYVAVSLLCIVSTIMIGKYILISEQKIDIVSMQELYVPSGQRAEIKLPDGTKVWLNSNSHLTYPSVFGKERRVKLMGEAFFDVAKNKEKPFIVSANSIDIKALGTHFNVSNYVATHKTLVYLVNGSVKVYYPDEENKGILLKEGQCIKEENRNIDFISADSDNLLWRNGIYVFKKEPLKDIVKKLELYYDINISIENPKIENYLYTGKFRQCDGVMEILKIIQRIHKFKIKQDEDLNTLILT